MMTAQEFKREMEERGWTVAALATYLDCSESTIWNWRSGRRRVPKYAAIAVYTRSRLSEIHHRPNEGCLARSTGIARRMVCQRCFKETNCHTMSMFNTQEICIECKDRERQHPDYSKAVEAERAAVDAGNYNFPGIGKPDDL